MIRAWFCAAALAALATPVLAAPAAKPAPPRVTYNVVDWSGVWSNYGSRNFDPTTESGKPQPNAPLTPAARKDYEAYLAAVAAGQPRGDIGCVPEGPPRIMRAPYPHEVVVTPKETWILSEFKGEIRRIYTDGRKAPTGDDLDHTYEGYSTGRWEGDTLVFDTVGLKEGTIDSGGLAHSDQLTIHERMRRVDADTLEDEITLTDPVVFTRPWTVVRQYKHRPDWEMKEFVCAENERNPVGANGQTGVVLQGK
jgi:hypothetical protein